MLTSDDYYDILAANERILEESRRVQRLATDSPRNVKLQERYLQQAANLGLIPAKFSSPRRTPKSLSSSGSSPSVAACPPTAVKRPVPPPDYGSGRPSRDRVARALARADSSLCNTAAAALAATEALYQGPSQHRFRGGRSSGSGSSDSDGSKDSAASTSSELSGLGGGSGARFRDGACSRSCSPRRERRALRVSQQGAKATENGRGGDGGGRQRGSTDGGSRTGWLLREPTPAFLRRWRAARKRKSSRKQVVRFLLRTSDELGDADGDTRAPGEGTAIPHGPPGSSSGPGVVIVYPGSSVVFPPAPLPYSLSEALEAARQQAQHVSSREWGPVSSPHTPPSRHYTSLAMQPPWRESAPAAGQQVQQSAGSDWVATPSPAHPYTPSPHHHYALLDGRRDSVPAVVAPGPPPAHSQEQQPASWVDERSSLPSYDMYDDELPYVGVVAPATPRSFLGLGGGATPQAPATPAWASGGGSSNGGGGGTVRTSFAFHPSPTSLPMRSTTPPSPPRSQTGSAGDFDGDVPDNSSARPHPPFPVEAMDSPTRSGSEASLSPRGLQLATPPPYTTGGGAGVRRGGSIDAASSVSEVEGGPSFGVWADGPGEAASSETKPSVTFESLRDQQSAISRDVQALMQRLADMRGRLGT